MLALNRRSRSPVCGEHALPRLPCAPAISISASLCGGYAISVHTRGQLFRVADARDSPHRRRGARADVVDRTDPDI